jgi:hypothetical protein
MNAALNDRIAHLEGLSADDQRSHAHVLLWLRFEEGLPIPVENPQLWPFVFPFLCQGYEAGEVRFMAWMYHAFNFPDVYNYLQCQSADVLKRALELDAGNAEVARLLVIELLNRLDHGLHELPDTFVLPPEVLLNNFAEVRRLQGRFPQLADVASKHGSRLSDYEKELRKGLQQHRRGRMPN